jgi:hypothetical protein
MQRSPIAALAAVTLTVLVACNSGDALAPIAAKLQRANDQAATVPNVPTVVVNGLQFPRGFAFGPDSAIYVAEAGTVVGNTTSTVGTCPQVPAPIGPWKGGSTGRISRVAMDGTRTTVIGGLPSASTPRGDVAGVADVAFVSGRLYALVTAGCSHGHPDDPSSVLRIYRSSGTSSRVVNLSRWIKNHPAASPNPTDFEPDGNWYSMVASVDRLFLVEANQGNLARVRPDLQTTSRVADISAIEDHIIPSGLANSGTDNSFYVGELTPLPAYASAASVLRYSRAGAVVGRLAGFTAVTGVATDAAGNVYVLESFTCPSTAPCYPMVGGGRVIKVAPDGSRTPVAIGLSFPTALRMGPDGALYVANFSYGQPNVGQILRIAL